MSGLQNPITAFPLLPPSRVSAYHARPGRRNYPFPTPSVNVFRTKHPLSIGAYSHCYNWSSVWSQSVLVWFAADSKLSMTRFKRLMNEKEVYRTVAMQTDTSNCCRMCFSLWCSAFLARDSMLSALDAIANPSVCPSHGWISLKRLNVSSKFFHHLIGPTF